ncbi:MAG: UDP-N-acetylglucosamine 2-epimerase [Cyclobacteriaceae bacterium]|jgi:GDP/UDP-N,N'-diacetylbacillosamine 2-epimerase (hydrolysing)|nr:UDP-N-acetylglucosamine 2-epimerase [Cytophagales bacterium]MCZ8327590.1 UDP-N-acetylglucosamine 2-epimerase [Cyclobacteriaceae bacterium]
MSFKICVVTGTRAEYGLLYWLLKEIQHDSFFELQICVTGMHLSPEFGLTYKLIEKDGFSIDKKVEMLVSSDTAAGVSKSIALGTSGFADAFNELKPDIILLLGDRFEILSAAIAAMIARIPIAHCHGGESTEGLIDEPIRHSITKMSHLHFTSTEKYRHRVIQLGEQPARVFNVGALGIENINRLSLLDKKSLEDELDFKFNKKNILITFHPVTLEESTAEQQFKELLFAIQDLKDTHFIFTMPNADTDGRIIIDLVKEFVNKNSSKSKWFTSMGQLRYLSTLMVADVVIGNSSSGIIEVPSFKKATINIGDRQRGRIFAESVINCEPKRDEIKRAIEQVYSSEFKSKLESIINPYGTRNSSAQIIDVLKGLNTTDLIKKKFYDIQ